MADTTLPGLLGTGDHASRPAATAVGSGALYACSDHNLIYQSDGSSWSTWADITGSGLSNPMTTAGDIIYSSDGSGTPARLAAGTDGHVLTLASGVPSWAAASGGSSSDPVADIFGTPDTAYEFATTSLSGLTAIGAAATEDADTTVPSCLFYKATDSSTAWHGRYLASPSTPFTAITKVQGANPAANYMVAALLVGVADPTTGAFVTCGVAWNTDPKFLQEKFTNRTTYSSSAGNWASRPAGTSWLGVVVNSTTSIDYYGSRDGYVWRKFVSANNPSLTVGSVGIGMKSENSTGFSCAFDFLRIWNSAKTFPGA